MVFSPTLANRDKSAIEPPSKQPRLACEQPDIEGHARRVGDALIQFTRKNGLEIEDKTSVDTDPPVL